MSVAALVLGSLALLLGLLPLLPGTSPLVLAGITLGAPLALVALGLGLGGRTQALQNGRPLRLPTVALALSAAASGVCLAWVLGFVLTWSRRPLPPRPPVGGSAGLGSGPRARYAARLTIDEHRTQPQLHQEPLFRRPQRRAALPLPSPAA